MSRLVWVAVGAAGGIWAYRKGSDAVREARERGMAGNVAAVGQAATALVGQAKALSTGMSAPASARGPLEPLEPRLSRKAPAPGRIPAG